MNKLNGKVAIVTGASKGIGAAIAKRLTGDGAGVVVNYASSAAAALFDRAEEAFTPAPGLSVYCSTKAAVDNITRALALELGPKARVVSVAPGLTLTEGPRDMNQGGDGSFQKYAISRTPLGRLGAPEDIANVVAFAVSDDAAWVSGEVIQAGGGIRL